MPKHTDTYARAYEACAEIFTELARFPTIELIRDRIGVNSPTTIKRAITEQWREGDEPRSQIEGGSDHGKS